MNAVILSGGRPPSKNELVPHLVDADLFIGVDGAADTLVKFEIAPDILIGDFDTARKKSVDALKQKGTEVVRLNCHKNQTDMQAAVDLAIEKGATDILMLGAVGSRIDHSLSNIMMLVRAHSKGVTARIVDAFNELTVANGAYDLYGEIGQTVSILPLTAQVVVTATGLEYPMESLVLPFGSSRGVSNVMISPHATLEVSGGYALIVKTTDKE